MTDFTPRMADIGTEQEEIEFLPLTEPAEEPAYTPAVEPATEPELVPAAPTSGPTPRSGS